MKVSGGKSMTLEFRVEVDIEPDRNSFHAYCPALKGLHVCGDTEQEALQNARDAAIAYIQSLVKHGDPIPIGITIAKHHEKALQNSKINHYMENLAVACA